MFIVISSDYESDPFSGSELELCTLRRRYFACVTSNDAPSLYVTQIERLICGRLIFN